jgi:hypothetical protein
MAMRCFQPWVDRAWRVRNPEARAGTLPAGEIFDLQCTGTRWTETLRKLLRSVSYGLKLKRAWGSVELGQIRTAPVSEHRTVADVETTMV